MGPKIIFYLLLASQTFTQVPAIGCGKISFCAVEKQAKGEEAYGTVIRNATIVYGTDQDPRSGDIAFTRDVISALGSINTTLIGPGTEIIEAHGAYISPGFIDSHTHDDVAILKEPQHNFKVFQGVTTIVIGNCGFSNYPNGNLPLVKDHLRTLLGNVKDEYFHEDFRSFATALKGNVGINVASLVGHGPLRISVMGYDNRPATDREVANMTSILDNMLSQGAIGLSLGLVYAPSTYAEHEELVSLGRIVAQRNKILTAHIRSYEGKLLDSVAEFISVLRESKAKGLLSHLQVAGRPYWGTSIKSALEMIQKAREEGVDVAVDMYPYLAGSSTIMQLLPPSAQTGGLDEFFSKLEDPEFVMWLQNLTESGSEPGWESKIALIGYENVVIGSVVGGHLKMYEGKTVIEGAMLMNIDEFDFLLYIIIEDYGQTNVIMFQQSQEDNNQVFKFPFQMVGSDSIPREGGKPHPRGFGTFPKVVGRMVKETKVLTLQEAVRKVSGLTAERFGIDGRGELKEGNKADVVWFDDTFLDTATFDDPTLQPTGVKGVWVNGVRIVKDGVSLSRLPGNVIGSG